MSSVGRRARVTLSVVKLALIGSIVAVGWGASVDATAPTDYSGHAVTAQTGHLEHVLAAHRCSPTGFDDGTVPHSAVVRSASGHLRHVSFDAGWRVYHRHGAAELVAVCRDEAPRG